jgi:hypothetical protein
VSTRSEYPDLDIVTLFHHVVFNPLEEEEVASKAYLLELELGCSIQAATCTDNDKFHPPVSGLPEAILP